MKNRDRVILYSLAIALAMTIISLPFGVSLRQWDNGVPMKHPGYEWYTVTLFWQPIYNTPMVRIGSFHVVVLTLNFAVAYALVSVAIKQKESES